MADRVNRRRFIERAAAIGGAIGLSCARAAEPTMVEPQRLRPIGEAKGIHPGRVVWVHDPQATNWNGPGDGHWYEPEHTSQDRVDGMMSRAVCEVTGQPTVGKAWGRLFRHLNGQRGKGDSAYRPGEKIAIKPNWVGMIWREGAADAKTYTLIKRQDYMNTGPQMIIALLRQLVGTVGVLPSDITICDTLAYLVHE